MKDWANGCFDAKSQSFSESYPDLRVLWSALCHSDPGWNASFPFRERKLINSRTLPITAGRCQWLRDCNCFFCWAGLEGVKRSGVGRTVSRAVVWRNASWPSDRLVSRYQPWAWVDRILPSCISRWNLGNSLGASAAYHDFPPLRRDRYPDSISPPTLQFIPSASTSSRRISFDGYPLHGEPASFRVHAHQ